MRRFVGLLCLVTAVAACSGKETTADARPQTSGLVADAPVETWLQVQYDDLRLRESAGMKGKVLATLKSGEQVRDLGEWSKDLETVELRGQRITAPWGKVEAKDGKQGWLFLGALAPVTDAAIADFKQGLDGLKKDDCKSIQASVRQFAEKMKGKPAAVADQAIPVLSDFVNDVVAKLNDALYQRPDFAAFETMYDEAAISAAPPKVRAEIEAWKACELHLDFPEGMCVIVPNPGIFDVQVDPFVTPPMRKFLAQRKIELAEGWAEDGGLVISPQQLADRAVFWDDFLVQNPTFVNAPFIRDLARNYALDLLFGQNNTPALGYEDDGALDKEFKAAYDAVLKDHPKTETAVLVREWCDILKAGGWKRSAKSDAHATKLYGL